MTPYTLHWHARGSLTINAVSLEAAEEAARDRIPEEAEITSVEVGAEYNPEDEMEME